MESFRWLSVVLSIILGLGMTRLLTGLVGVFRARQQNAIDWVPLVWAVCLFFVQVQFWWALYDIPDMHWTFGAFIVLVSLPALLFVASALLLPLETVHTGASLRAYFEEEGRWALIAVSLYFLAAYAANLFFWHASALQPIEWLNLAQGIMPLALLATRRRSVHVIVTLAYVPATLANVLMASDVY